MIASLVGSGAATAGAAIGVLRAVLSGVALMSALLLPYGAVAIDFLDKQVQVHGFVETQVRAQNDRFADDLELAQWYNVLNVEVELDFAPDGVGPFDLLQAFVRVEGRYDAVYSNGFGMLHSVNTYGDEAESLPNRLRDAMDKEFGGTQPAVDIRGRHSVRRIGNKDPQPLQPDCSEAADGRTVCTPGERQGFPGFDTFFRQMGADNVAGNVTTGIVGAELNPVTGEETEASKTGVPMRRSDDPATRALEGALNFAFAYKDFRGPNNTSTQILGPWLPKNFIRSNALNPDVANSFRGRIAPNALSAAPHTIFGFPVQLDTNPDGMRYYEDDPALASLPVGFQPSRIDPRDPFIAFIQDSPDNVITDFGGVPFNQTVPITFGGDFSGVVSCIDPTGVLADDIRAGDAAPPGRAGCVRGSHRIGEPSRSYQEPLVVRLSGGAAESPFRPAPDVSKLGEAVDGSVVGSERRRNLRAQGLYTPSKGLVRVLRNGDLDSHEFNFTETERSFNRGSSQERTKEIKEAYLDVEMFDSRLWLRLGLQNIVWGKTELFRTTDQFNPQDLALATLPNLEESRIALWSARAVYSLYDVGPFDDVRLELAANFDEFEPADLGACGEPYTLDVVCTLTTGIFTHGVLGVGVAGFDRPDDPWKDASEIEVGGRIEWRWDRFSFALTNFWGYSDFPYLDSIFYYDRAVDLDTSRPVAASRVGDTSRTCGNFAGEIAPDQRHGSGADDAANPNDLSYNSSFASHPLSVTPGGVLVETRQGSVITSVFPDPFRGGVGRDAGCLRPGGAPGESNAFRFDDALLEDTNALYNHAANQQVFGWVCLATQGIGAALDPSACAWTIFGSTALLNATLLPIPLAELLSTVFAGDQSANFTQQFLAVTLNTQRGGGSTGTLPAVALAPTNQLFNDPTLGNSLPLDLDGNGIAGDNSGCDVPGGACDLGGFDGFRSFVKASLISTDPLSLDSSLTNEQRSMLGCGPFWASRCDSSQRFDPDARLIDGTPKIIGSGGNEPGANQNGDGIYAEFGGIDLLNTEGSALVQAWPGVEGTLPGYFVTDRIAAPGTMGGFDSVTGVAPGFDGGPVCTRYDQKRKLVKLPGCRGVESLEVVRDVSGDPVAVRVGFEAGYLPQFDGCVIGSRVRRTNGDVVPVVVSGRVDPGLMAQLELCNGATTQRTVTSALAIDLVTPNPNCVPPRAGFFDLDGMGGDDEDLRVCTASDTTLEELPLIHPLAGCIDSPVQSSPDSAVCDRWMFRNLTEEFLGGTAQLFQSELAAVSWNFLQFLVISSCNSSDFDLEGFNRSGIRGNPSAVDDPECFVAGNIRARTGPSPGPEDDTPKDPRLTENLAYKSGRCSLVTPQFCRNVKGFFTAAGVTSNAIRASGNSRFGRRTFLWHSGGEAVLRYEQRNVLGFATDFAEDVTKTNWGMEFTWIEGVQFADNGSRFGVSKSDTVNLTISVDRPTFINFLNPNRTFFFNTQWFFNYIPNYDNNFTVNGPVNVLFTFACFTGYFQDRLMPNLVTVYDFQSTSGAAIPSLTYRFTESFSVSLGMLYFWGKTELRDMPVRDIAPAVNRTGKHAYKVGVDNALSLVRERDELFLRLRWTF